MKSSPSISSSDPSIVGFLKLYALTNLISTQANHRESTK
jgi:hypothetical protein